MPPTTESAPVWKGWLKRGETPDTVTGQLTDSWGWVVTLTGTRSPEGGYVLEGRLGPAPEALRIPIIDEVDKPA